MGTDEKITDNIVNILTHKKENNGTGFYFCEDMIFTCAHVCEAADAVDDGDIVYFKDRVGEQVYEAKVVYCDFDKDIAILKSDRKSDNYFLLGDYEYVNGEICHSFGYLGEEETGVDLWSKNMRYEGSSTRIGRYQLSNANSVTGGFSGAPVWNDAYKFLGMLVTNTNQDQGRLILDAFFIGVPELKEARQRFLEVRGECKEQEKNEFAKILEFDKHNYAVYNGLVMRIRQGETIVPLLGNSLSEYAFGRKNSMVDRLCKVLFYMMSSVELAETKKILKEGEPGLSVDYLLRDSEEYKVPIIEFFKDVFNSSCVSDFQMEEETLSLIPYMQYAIRFMPDGLLEKIAERRRIAVNAAYPEDNHTWNKENGLEIYSLCGNLEKNILYSLSDYKENKKKCCKKLAEWLGMKQILYVGVNFDDKMMELCRKIGRDQEKHFALVACAGTEAEKNEVRNKLRNLNIDAILYDQDDVIAVEYILHKLLVDTHNERFERRYNRLDYRFSQQALYGRKEEVKALQDFLESDQDQDPVIRFLWLQVSGYVGSGKSKLIYDFSRQNAPNWQLIWVDCNRNDQFIEKSEEFKAYLSNSHREKNVLLVFDDFYLHPFAFEKCLGFLPLKRYNKLRIIFVTDEGQRIFQEEKSESVHKSCLVTQYAQSPLKVEPLSKDTIIEICINYASYLKASVTEKLYQSDETNDFSELVMEIDKTYEQCLRNKENLVLYICLIRTLQWLRLLDSNAGSFSDQNILLTYMTRDKLTDDLRERANMWDIGKYTKDFYERDKNRKNQDLRGMDGFMREMSHQGRREE